VNRRADRRPGDRDTQRLSHGAKVNGSFLARVVDERLDGVGLPGGQITKAPQNIAQGGVAFAAVFGEEFL